MEVIDFGITCNDIPLVYRDELACLKRNLEIILTDEEEITLSNAFTECKVSKRPVPEFEIQGMKFNVTWRKLCRKEAEKFSEEEHHYSLMNREDKPGDLDWRPYCLVCDTFARAAKTDIGYKCHGCKNETLNSLYGIDKNEITFS